MYIFQIGILFGENIKNAWWATTYDGVPWQSGLHSIRFVFRGQSRQNVGPNPGRDHGTCVPEQEHFTLHGFSSPRGMNWYLWG